MWNRRLYEERDITHQSLLVVGEHPVSSPMAAPPTKPSPVLRPNFFSNHSVVIDRPIDTVFPIIATSEGHERVTRLSGLCSGFELLQADSLPISPATSLADAHARDLPASGSAVEDAGDVSDVRHLPRQYFTLTETIPILFGLIKISVHLSGTLTWDEQEKLALYESSSDSGIAVWKLRRFEEVEGGKTKVNEEIRGNSPWWLKGFVQHATTKSHMCVISLVAHGRSTPARGDG